MPYNINTNESIQATISNPINAKIDQITVYGDTTINDDRKILVSVKDAKFGAKGNGATEDSPAIQKAVDYVYANGGGVILFPAATYIVEEVNIRENITYQGVSGAVLKRPDNLSAKIGVVGAKWARIFTNVIYSYEGPVDSKPLIIRNLTFDGNCDTQGPYQDFELEQSAGVFLTGEPTSTGKLKFIVENCSFKNAVGDGIHTHYNLNGEIYNCTGENNFRGTLVISGEKANLKVNGLTTTGVGQNGAGVHLENVRGSSYNFENFKLTNSFFEIGIDEGATVTGNNIVADGSILFYSPMSTIKISNSQFTCNPQNHIMYPYNVTFENCQFNAIENSSTSAGEILPAAPIVLWNISGNNQKNQKLTFTNCTFAKSPSSKVTNPVYGILTGLDMVDYNNVLTVNGGTFTSSLNVGIGMKYWGGNWRLSNATMQAATPLLWDGINDSHGNGVANIVVDNLNIKSSKYMYLTGYSTVNDNKLEHKNMVLDAACNFITSSWGVSGNQYVGNRVILGSSVPTVNTHGFVGDIYRLQDNSHEWKCTKAGYYDDRYKRNVSATWSLVR